jgi:hypothetical protein
MTSDDVLSHSGAVHASTFDTFLSSTKSLLLGTGLTRQQVALVGRLVPGALHFVTLTLSAHAAAAPGPDVARRPRRPLLHSVRRFAATADTYTS